MRRPCLHVAAFLGPLRVSVALAPALSPGVSCLRAPVGFLGGRCGPALLTRDGCGQAQCRRGITMSAEDGGMDGVANRPLSRRAFLNGLTKTAGVAGAGFLYRGAFVRGPLYAETPDLRGKTALVTGGNTGLGKETAIRLAQLGADVTIGARDTAKAAAALEDIKAQAGPGARVRSAQLDLASLGKITAFAKEYARDTPRLDILVNNAGVMAIPERQTTEDGFERQFGINHLGHFHLTKLLMPSLLKSGDARVVTVSSSAHMIPTRDDWSEALGERFSGQGSYAPWKAYGLSKVANIMFTKELQRRVSAKTDSVTCMALHPGACRTELGRYLFNPSTALEGSNALLLPLLGALSFFTRSARQGAQTQIKCSAKPELRGSRAGGKYFVDCQVAKSTELSRDAAAAGRLWEASEALTGSKFAL